MLTLRVLGSAFIEGDDGQPMAGAASQRRLIALLALLAVAGEEGLTRDRILGLLWPEGDPERARHALTQSLYHVRRALRCDDLFVTGGGSVRLDRSRLTSDVALFREAVAAGDGARAAALYRGPFLDGFFLSGSAEFEQWTSLQRDRFAAMAAELFERLAGAAEKRGDLAEAVGWRRRLATLDPLDSTRAVALMNALAGSGDRAGAIQHARLHAEMLRQQLEIEPPASVLSLERRLREEARADGLAGRAALAMVPPPPAEAVALLDEDALEDEPEPGDHQPEAGGEPVAESSTAGHTTPGSRRTVRLRLAILTIGIIAVVAAVATRRDRTPPPADAPKPVLVVAPFRVTGADRSLGFLREGLVELLAARLADDSAARSADPGSVLAAWRAAGLTAMPEVPREEAVRIAALLGAERVVVGSVIGNPSRVVLSASLIEVADGRVSAEASIEGTTDSLTALVDRLAAQLLAADAGEQERLAGHTTPSVAALRAFLRGQAAYRRGAYLEAVQQYETALERDTAFALAALHLAVASDRLNDAEQHRRALLLAWQTQGALSTRDRAHLVALAGPRFPAPSPEAEYLAAWERAAALAPDRVEVWQELGERFVLQGGALGVPDAAARARQALLRAMQLDPTHVPTRRLLVMLAAREGDSVTLAHLTSAAALRDSAGRTATFLRWRVAAAQGDSATLRRIAEQMPRFDEATLRDIAMTTLFDGTLPDHGERALRVRQLRARRPADRLDVLLAQHALALNAGRPRLALAMTEQVQELLPGTRAHLRLRVLDALYGDGDRAAGDSAARTLEAWPATSDEAGRVLALADVCVVEQWRLAHGATGNTRRAVEQLRDSTAAPGIAPVGTAPLACAALLDAMLAVREGDRSAKARVRSLDSLMLSGPGIGDAGTYAHLAVSRLYVELGDRAGALASIRRRGYMTGWPRYLATARWEEARLAAATRDRPSAIESLRRLVALRPSPELGGEPRRREAEAMLREIEPRD